jgi:transcription-repair coupling factor (superfamily II helicase)
MSGGFFSRLSDCIDFDRLKAQAKDEGGAAVSGLSEGARPFAVSLIRLRTELPLCVILSSNAELDRYKREIPLFSNLIAGAERPLAIATLPSLETGPYTGLSPHLEVLSERVNALARLVLGDVDILLTTTEGFSFFVPAPRVFSSWVRTVRQGEEVLREELIDFLARAGYRRRDMAGEPGDFSIRGGILDICPPSAEGGVRLEFSGDAVDSIRRFDPGSQRSTTAAESARIVPIREFLINRDSAERFRRLAAERHPGAAFERDRKAKTEALEAQGRFEGVEFFGPLLGEAVQLGSYLEGFSLLFMEPDTLTEAYERSFDRMAERHAEAEREGKIALSPQDLFLAPSGLSAAARGPGIRFQSLDADAGESFRLRCRPVRKFDGRLPDFAAEVRRERRHGRDVLLFMATSGEAARLTEYFEEEGTPATLSGDSSTWERTAGLGALGVFTGALHEGFELPVAGLSIYSGWEILGVRRAPPKRVRDTSAAFVSDFRDLRPGDFVVHVDHGIGVFEGLKELGTEAGTGEFMEVRYLNNGRLYVPLDRLDRVQKYSSAEGAHPRVDTLGGVTWNRIKGRVKKAMRDMAAELLNLYASRKILEKVPFHEDSGFQQEFEAAFEYQETPDQARAIEEVKHDQESPRIMDRLLCGDVGYGKTEVAMRAAFKAVYEGRQVAVLAPTTVLAFQHHRTFTERFRAFPVAIEMLSRFRTARQQKEIVKSIKEGKLDIVIGTHRLLSGDIAFHDLGLLIVDEEQRFGVAQKEKIKRLRKGVDVLTMTATPIPRTLQMSLMGIRDMSIIETPPKNRLAIETRVARLKPEIVREAIRRELERHGQVYFIHDRVETIHSLAAYVRGLLNGGRLGVAHGQMREKELEQIMLDFIEGKFDVLVSTTIIENGIDLPNVNTIIVDHAHRFGLAQLYQLRGRVGRSDRRAYAYLLVPEEAELTPIAKRRLHALQEFSELGSGFRIAAYDLEIRGAGNVLGPEQHGHIEAVGIDMYMKLLEETVRELKGEPAEIPVQTAIRLGLDIRIPHDYIPDSSVRLVIYKRVSSARTGERIDSMREEVEDRFGKAPQPVLNLLDAAKLKCLAEQLKVFEIKREGVFAAVKFTEHSGVDPQGLVGLLQSRRRWSFSPEGVLKFPVSAGAAALREIREVLMEMEHYVTVSRRLT